MPYASSPPRRWILRSQFFRLGRCLTAGTNDKHSVLPAPSMFHELGEKRELKLGGLLARCADARFRSGIDKIFLKCRTSEAGSMTCLCTQAWPFWRTLRGNKHDDGDGRVSWRMNMRVKNQNSMNEIKLYRIRPSLGKIPISVAYYVLPSTADAAVSIPGTTYCLQLHLT